MVLVLMIPKRVVSTELLLIVVKSIPKLKTNSDTKANPKDFASCLSRKFLIASCIYGILLLLAGLINELVLVIIFISCGSDYLVPLHGTDAVARSFYGEVLRAEYFSSFYGGGGNDAFTGGLDVFLFAAAGGFYAGAGEGFFFVADGLYHGA